METPRETLDEQRERRQFEILETFDDKTLAEMKSDALKSYSELEKLILAISRIQEGRGQEVLF
jgi:hypothetical protein|nr:MAG TPA: hypothetical protein [Caudoviricetes sp.]